MCFYFIYYVGTDKNVYDHFFVRYKAQKLFLKFIDYQTKETIKYRQFYITD